MKPRHAEAAFNQLALDRMVALTLSTPWRRRLEIIQLAEDAAALVKALPEEEVYWTVKERGIDDSLSLISMTSHDQFQYLIDIDCWIKDRLDLKSVLTWYRVLGRCNEAKVAEWFSKTDDDLIIHSFKKIFKLFKIEEEKDISEEYESMPFHTIDGIYYLHFFDDGTINVIMPLLNVLYQHNRPRFYSLIEGVLWDADAEAEDDAFRWRQSRIADKGFPDLDEALHVYQLLPDKDMERLAAGLTSAAPGCATASEAHADVMLRYMFDHELKAAFLSDAIRSVNVSECIDRFQAEILTLANKIAVADTFELKDLSSIRRALRKALGYSNAGLEILSNGDLDKAQAALSSLHAAVLFQVGYTHVLKLKKRFQQQPGRLWLTDRGAFRTFYDTPWAEAVQGIMMPRPLFYEGLANPGSPEYRDFESRGELRLAEQALAIVAAAEYILFDACKIDIEQLLHNYAATDRLSPAGEPRCSRVFLTVLANQVLYSRTSPEPLSAPEVAAFLNRFFQPGEKTGGFVIKAGVRRDCLAWLAGLSRRECSAMPGLEPFVEACLAILQEELGGLVGRDVAPRYITSLLLKNGA